MDNKKNNAPESIVQISWTHQQGQSEDGFPWGPHKIPINFSFEDINLALEKRENRIHYKRVCNGECFEKTVLAEKGRLFISPVEPFHKPVGISTHLLVEFTQPLLLEPRASRNIMVTFPLELASVIAQRQDSGKVLEIFSLSPAKFTLYGSIRSGLICRYWKSEVYNKLPLVNQVREGVMEINVQNTSGKWAEIKKAAFSAQGMKIYFNAHLVSLKASVRIISDYSAETTFVDQPLRKGMRKALEQFTPRLMGLPAKTLMEEGY